VNICQSCKQERDCIVYFLRLLAVSWPGKNYSFTRNWYQWTHWISNLRERQSVYLIVLARRRTQSQCSSSSSSRERATNHIATPPNISSSVHFTSQIAKLSFYCLKIKDQNCCPQSRFTSSGRRPTKMRLWTWALPRTPLGELTALPSPSSWIRRMGGKGGEGRALMKINKKICITAAQTGFLFLQTLYGRLSPCS